MNWTQIGKLLLYVGAATALLGGGLILTSKLAADGRIPWLGRLPGDIRVERKGFSCFLPLTTSIVVSLLLTVMLNLLLRLFKR